MYVKSINSVLDGPFYPGDVAFTEESGDLYMMNTTIVMCIKYYIFEASMND